MTPAAVLVTLKLRRFEVLVATVAALVAGVLGLSISARILALGVSRQCLESAFAPGVTTSVDAGCQSLLRQGAEILGETYLTGEGTLAVSVMGLLPFLVGLLLGVPIVASELEARTAQTAWSLSGDRTRWLVRQLVPIALVVGPAVVFAAVAAALVVPSAVAWGRPEPSLIGLSGPLTIVRTFAAFGLGLATGAMARRHLPALMIAAALSICLLIGSGVLHDRWLSSLPAEQMAQATSADEEPETVAGMLPTGWAVLTPDGRLLTSQEGRAIATGAGVPPAGEFDSQDTPALEWYTAHGYRLVPVGVRVEVAMGWAPIEAILFSGAGFASVAVTILRIRRLRPR